MNKGNVSGAVKLLTNNMTGGILPLDDETVTLLRSKHPEPKDCDPDAISNLQLPEVHPVAFDAINEDSVRSAAMTTQGGSGTSGLDADG